MADGQRGSAALLTLVGGGLALLIALVIVVVVTDLVLSRGQAQIAADAAALAAVNTSLVANPFGAGSVGAPENGSFGAAAAAELARRNGARLVECCGNDVTRPQVVVAVTPRSHLVRLVIPQVRAPAAAALAAAPLGSFGAGWPDGAGAPPGAAATADGKMWPVAGRVSSGFGMRTHPLTGTRRLHAGVDLAASSGTPIRAAATGVVVAAGWRGGYGYAVDLRHGDGMVTRYGHQSRLLTRTGQHVAAGQVIGLVGSTGSATGPHLHFEVRTVSGAIDPRVWLPHI